MALVLGVALFLVIGFVRRVPMYLGMRGARIADISDGRTDGEVAPGELPDEDIGRPRRGRD